MRLTTAFILLVSYSFLRSSVVKAAIDIISALQRCDDVMKRDTTYDDIETMFDRFTKRYTGKLSFIGDYPSGITSCRMDPLPPVQNSLGWIPVAMGPRDYIHSLMCGTCLKITPRKGVKRNPNNFEYNPDATYFATAVDQCIHCKPGEIRMYKEGEGSHDIIYEAIDCPEIVGKEGFFRVRMNRCTDKKMRVQVKNTKLPTTSLELFQDDSWKCMKRTSDNYFLLTLPKNSYSYSFPMKARATSVTGQIIGFTIDALEHNRDIIVPAQYSPFDTVASGSPPKLKCYVQANKTTRNEVDKDEYDLKRRNMTIDDLHKLPNHVHLLRPDGHLIHQPSKIVNIVAKPNKNRVDNRTTNNITNFANHVTKLFNLKKMNNAVHNSSTPVLAFKPNRTLILKLLTSPNFLHSSSFVGRQRPKLPIIRNNTSRQFCSNKNDGRYAVPGNCAAFMTCAKGIPLLKTCPRGLLFNHDDAVCDWPNHVQCTRTLGAKYIFAKKTTEEEEIYTKKFVKAK